jgi:hypothetical protein
MSFLPWRWSQSNPNYSMGRTLEERQVKDVVEGEGLWILARKGKEGALKLLFGHK